MLGAVRAEDLSRGGSGRSRLHKAISLGYALARIAAHHYLMRIKRVLLFDCLVELGIL